jgi:hypothetical protein
MRLVCQKSDELVFQRDLERCHEGVTSFMLEVDGELAQIDPTTGYLRED